ncbi:MAG: bifunctional folylpolyglutamate synthase/dihydrofolate synthase [Anaerolineales bacterium]|nr:bifunctional folylpolyglutamate synthase/dihydrofolate synthase [Anaerolineales bacterium]
MHTYQEALDWLYSFVDFSAQRKVKYSPETFDLSRMRALMALLGNPQDRYRTLHVAGSKGKGSVSAMCASGLMAAGYKTGLYTSPHLQDFRERIQLNGEYISEADLVAVVRRLQELAPQVPGITTFELNTALAFEYFARQAVDVGVIEVGLGGRLDATNVITPLVSVITLLGYEHMDLLGNTLALIAGEKAGIIKPGVPVVSAPQSPEALAVLERVAAERAAPLTVVGRDVSFQPRTHSLDGQTLVVNGETFSLPLLGAHQVENAAVAYAALQALRAFLPISAEAVRAGLASVRWPGRFEILQSQPFVVADGAHNADSAQRLAAALADYFPGRRVHLIFGASADKDIAGMLAALLPRVASVICTQAVHPRALEPEQLAAQVAALSPTAHVECVPAVQPALARALTLAAPEDVVLACGSLFIVAEVQAAHKLLIADHSMER